MNLNLVFSKSMNLNLVFSQSMNLNLEIKNKMKGSNQCRHYAGQRGPYPPNGRLCPHFGLLKILLLKHHVTRQQTMMEKGIITFKHNSPLMFFRFFAKLMATNCCTLIWRNIPSYWHAFTNVSRKRHVSMQNCYRYFVSDYDMKQCVKTFFQRPAVLIFRAHSTFRGHSQRRN